MKRIWLAITALIMIIGLCIGEIIWIINITNNIKSQISSVNQLVLNENIDDAISLSEEILNEWDNKHNKLAIFIDHNSLEGIDQTMDIINTCLTTDNIPEFHIKVAKINALLEDLTDTEMPSIYNIL